MAAPVEVSGISVVVAGSFNPAIFHPQWFVEKEQLTAGAADQAMEKLVLTPQLTAYTADWLSVQITLEQAVFSTVQEGREPDLRDLVKNVFEYLPETPVDALGINSDTHFNAGSEELWHQIGDMFLPKDYWGAFFQGDEWKPRSDGLTNVGLRTVTVEAYPASAAGWIRWRSRPRFE